MRDVFLPRNRRNTRKAEGGNRGSCPRFTRRAANGEEMGFSGVAHGLHGRHGMGDETREPRKRKRRRNFLTTKHTKDTKGGGREPEKLSANHAKGREWGRNKRRDRRRNFLPRKTQNTRKAEESPTEHTDDTKGGGEAGRDRKTNWRGTGTVNRSGRGQGFARETCEAYAGFSRSGRGAIRRNR